MVEVVATTDESRGLRIDHGHAHRVLFERGILHRRFSLNALWLERYGLGSITVRQGGQVVEREFFHLGRVGA